MSAPKILEVEQCLTASPRRWLVTGAAGFVASHIAARLLELGQEVVVLDNFSTGYAHNIEGLLRQAEATRPGCRDKFTLIEGDIRDLDCCRRATAGVSYVLHQAALGSVPRSVLKPLETLAVNVDGFGNILEAIRGERGCESLVYASSSSVYGDSPELPKSESQQGRPLSPYAASKQVNETYASAWTQSYGATCRGLRYFNVVGTRQDPQGAYAAVIPRWISSLLAGEAPTIFGDGETSRDFCPVQNVVEANILAATAPSTTDDVFNIALGGRTTLNELFIMLKDGMKILGLGSAPPTPRYEPFRHGDIRHSHADIDRARSQLGYAPRVSLAQGLETTMRWFYERDAN